MAQSILSGPIPPGICHFFLKWLQKPHGRAGRFIQNPHGGAEKKVSFFSTNFDVTVKYWKKGTTLTASRRIDKSPTPRREEVFWQSSLRWHRQDARQMPGGMTTLEINGAIRIVIFKFKNFRGRYLWCPCTLAMKTVNKTATVLPWGAIGRPRKPLFLDCFSCLNHMIFLCVLLFS